MGHFGPDLDHSSKTGTPIKILVHNFLGLGWVNIILKNELHTLKTVGVVRLFPFWAISGPIRTINSTKTRTWIEILFHDFLGLGWVNIILNKHI